MQQNQQQQPQQPQQQPAVQETIVDQVLKRITQLINTGELMVPQNYSYENAIRSAWLMLQDVESRDKKPALEVCTRHSIVNAFLDMVMKGLSVVKKQGYFVVYGNELSFDQSYLGDIAIAKRDANVKEVNGVAVYQDDEFEYEIDLTKAGRKKVTVHKQKFANIDPAKFVGAYAIVEYNDGTVSCEVMTLQQIKAAWALGGSRGDSPAHRNFPDQMGIKTVINRALKIVNGSSDDAAVMPKDPSMMAMRLEVKENANQKAISMEDDAPPARMLNEGVNIPVPTTQQTEMVAKSEPVAAGKQQELTPSF